MIDNMWFPFDISLVLRRRHCMGNLLFSSSTEAFLITQWNCTSICSCSAIKMNQWLGGGVERAYGYAARQNEQSLWLYKRPLHCHISDLYNKIIHCFRSKTTTLPRCARQHSGQRGWSSPPCRGDVSAGKRSHGNRPSSPERVRLLQTLLPCPQKRWCLRPIPDLRLLNHALVKRLFRMITLKQMLSAQGILPRAYCNPANEYRSWAQLSTAMMI